MHVGNIHGHPMLVDREKRKKKGRKYVIGNVVQ